MVLSFVIALLPLIRKCVAVKNRQAEFANMTRVGYGVDSGDPPIRDRAFKHHQQPPPWGYEDSHSSVYEHGPRKLGTVLERRVSHGLSATDFRWHPQLGSGAVSSQYDIWVEQFQKRIEIPAS